MESNAAIRFYPGTYSLICWVFAALVIAIGFINLFWGNDFGFGIFLILLSGFYLPPLFSFFRFSQYAIFLLVQAGLAVFIIIASLGVGELFDKIDLMMNSFQM